MEKLRICSHFLKDVFFYFFNILAVFLKEMYLDDSPLQDLDVVLWEGACCLSVIESVSTFLIFILIFTVLLILLLFCMLSLHQLLSPKFSTEPILFVGALGWKK